MDVLNPDYSIVVVTAVRVPLLPLRSIVHPVLVTFRGISTMPPGESFLLLEIKRKAYEVRPDMRQLYQLEQKSLLPSAALPDPIPELVQEVCHIGSVRMNSWEQRERS